MLRKAGGDKRRAAGPIVAAHGGGAGMAVHWAEGGWDGARQKTSKGCSSNRA